MSFPACYDNNRKILADPIGSKEEPDGYYEVKI